MKNVDVWIHILLMLFEEMWAKVTFVKCIALKKLPLLPNPVTDFYNMRVNRMHVFIYHHSLRPDSYLTVFREKSRDLMKHLARAYPLKKWNFSNTGTTGTSRLQTHDKYASSRQFIEFGGK